MKKIILFIFTGLLISSSSCKKALDQAKQNYLLSIVSNGRWFLQNYTEYGADSTAEFAGYEFQFYDNDRLDATKDSSTISGTWLANTNDYTMTVNFPPSSALLQKLSKVWTVTDSKTGLVFAQTQTPLGLVTIQLKKL